MFTDDMGSEILVDANFELTAVESKSFVTIRATTFASLIDSDVVAETICFSSDRVVVKFIATATATKIRLATIKNRPVSRNLRMPNSPEC
ncbi:MAG: hypothetical protein IIA53_06995 [Chloroflexi bacterium]|nr:hypothetical protein [Chloroflexota bacterium]